MITGVHHITLLVRDLEKAVSQWRQQLGIEVVLYDELPGRGVKTARFKTGDVWLVLVQPVADGEPRRVLEERGEGLFLLSLGVESLQVATERVVAAGGAMTADQPRPGLENWLVNDVSPDALSGALVQLCEEQ
ncbi:MAG: VOC family protein [Luminiphilus sp.]|nr:VOC family protein [Luminiphilus sp.]